MLIPIIPLNTALATEAFVLVLKSIRFVSIVVWVKLRALKKSSKLVTLIKDVNSGRLKKQI